MDNNLINYGWSGSGDCSIDTINNYIVFNSLSHIYNINTLLDNSNKIIVEGSFIYKGVDNGLILWYNDNLEMIIFSTDGHNIRLQLILDGSTLTLRSYKLDKIGIINPNIDDIITLKVEIDSNHIACYYNNQLIITYEDPSFSSGYFGIYGETNAICSSFSVKSNKITNWNLHIENGNSIKPDATGKLVEFNISNSTYTYIEQNIDTSIDGSYTISLEYNGSIRIEVLDGTTLLDSIDLQSTEYQKGELTFTITSTPMATIRIGSNTIGTHYIRRPQVENKPFSTSFTKDTRQQSNVTFPASNLRVDNGGIAFWFIPKHNYSSELLPLFYYNDNFKLTYQSGIFTFTYGDSQVTVSKAIAKDKEYYISCIWDNGNSILLSIYDKELDEHTSNTVYIDTKTINTEEFICIGSTPTDVANIIIDNFVAYKKLVTLDKLLEHKDNQDIYDPQIAIKSTFDNNTFLYDKNIISIPIPRADYPIIVETSNGNVYERVYFIKDDKYSLYNTEEFTYDGTTNQFRVLYDNLLKVKAYTKDNTTIFDNITYADNIITINDLTEEHIGKDIVIMYMVKNTYCINYNSKFDQYELELSNVGDGEIIIKYQDSDLNKKLVKTVELNPFKASNNSGFIYVEDKPRKLETFDVKITPDSIVANGFDIATITIDCLSKDSVPTSYVDLVVTNLNKQYGAIYKYVSPEEQEWLDYKNQYGEEAAIQRYGYLITDEHRSGRFIYKYKAGKIPYEESKGYDLIDQISIYDRISKIGIQIPIRLVREL